MTTRILGVAEIAERLQVSHARARVLCKTRRLASRKVGPVYTAREQDVEKLAQELSRNPRANLFRQRIDKTA